MLPTLENSATRAVFQLSGNFPVLMERLKKLQRDCEMTGKAILIKWLAIPSDPNPHDFFIFPRALSALTVSMALNSNWTVFSQTMYSLDRKVAAVSYHEAFYRHYINSHS